MLIKKSSKNDKKGFGLSEEQIVLGFEFSHV